MRFFSSIFVKSTLHGFLNQEIQSSLKEREEIARILPIEYQLALNFKSHIIGSTESRIITSFPVHIYLFSLATVFCSPTFVLTGRHGNTMDPPWFSPSKSCVHIVGNIALLLEKDSNSSLEGVNMARTCLVRI